MVSYNRRIVQDDTLYMLYTPSLLSSPVTSFGSQSTDLAQGVGVIRAGALERNYQLYSITDTVRAACVIVADVLVKYSGLGKLVETYDPYYNLVLIALWERASGMKKDIISQNVVSPSLEDEDAISLAEDYYSWAIHQLGEVEGERAILIAVDDLRCATDGELVRFGETLNMTVL